MSTGRTEHRRVCTNLESVEFRVPVKRHLRLYPLARTRVLVMKAHKQHGVDGIDNGVADASSLRQVGALVADGMVLIVAHGVPLC